MATTSKSAKLFQERSGLIRTIRGPLPYYVIGANKAHDVPVQAPLPLPQLLGLKQGDPSPDRGAAQEWPHG